MALTLKPITVGDAAKWIAIVHRHCGQIQGALFAVSVVNSDGKIVGCATVGRPCRSLQDGWTALITRVGTDGARNGCSILYGACIGASRKLGYKRIYTYTISTESGSSLRAERKGVLDIVKIERLKQIRSEARPLP